MNAFKQEGSSGAALMFGESKVRLYADSNFSALLFVLAGETEETSSMVQLYQAKGNGAPCKTKIEITQY